MTAHSPSTPIFAILFDVGGVLVSDWWETVLLTHGTGVAWRLGVDHKQAEAAGSAAWAEVCHRSADEAEFWSAVGGRLGQPIPAAMIADAERKLIRVRPDCSDILGRLGERVRLGVISNNTSFWWPKQERMADISSHIVPELHLMSYEHGIGKDSDPSLYAIAAARTSPSHTLVIDDRPRNLAIAREHGFHAARWTLDERQLPVALQDVLNGRWLGRPIS